MHVVPDRGDRDDRGDRNPDPDPPAEKGTAGPRAVQDPDKAYAELLQEVRVAQTGVQILLGFLMTFAFSPRFATLTTLQSNQYVLTLVVAFGAAAFLTAPAPFHRVVFRHGLRTRLIAVSNRLALIGLVLLMLAMSSALLLVVNMVMGPGRSALIASVIFSGIVWLWFGMPMWHRLRHDREHQP